MKNNFQIEFLFIILVRQIMNLPDYSVLRLKTATDHFCSGYPVIFAGSPFTKTGFSLCFFGMNMSL